MFGDRNPAGGGNQCGERRDIERPLPVAAGADDVDRPGRCRNPQHFLPQRGNRAGEFRHALAPHPERHQKPAELGRSDAAREDQLERGFRLVLGQARS